MFIYLVNELVFGGIYFSNQLLSSFFCRLVLIYGQVGNVLDFLKQKNMLFKKLYVMGDLLEDKVRGKLSHYPIIYAFIGGLGVVIFWRGVWHTMDFLMEFFTSSALNFSITSTSMSGLPWWDGPLSIVIGTALLLVVGLFVNNFIGNEIILSGLKREKKIVEKTEEEVIEDLEEDDHMKSEVFVISDRLKSLEDQLKKNKLI